MRERGGDISRYVFNFFSFKLNFSLFLLLLLCDNTKNKILKIKKYFNIFLSEFKKNKLNIILIYFQVKYSLKNNFYRT
jgi:hypothetical protein